MPTVNLDQVSRRVSFRAVLDDSPSVRVREQIEPKHRPPCTVRRYRWKTTWRQWLRSALGGFTLRHTVRRVPVTTARYHNQCEFRIYVFGRSVLTFSTDRNFVLFLITFFRGKATFYQNRNMSFTRLCVNGPAQQIHREHSARRCDPVVIGDVKRNISTVTDLTRLCL